MTLAPSTGDFNIVYHSAALRVYSEEHEETLKVVRVNQSFSRTIANHEITLILKGSTKKKTIQDHAMEFQSVWTFLKTYLCFSIKRLNSMVCLVLKCIMTQHFNRF